VAALFRKKQQAFDGQGLVLFARTRDAMIAEKALKRAGIATRLVAPPISKREGCDLAVEFNSVERLAVQRELQKSHIEYLDIDLIQDDAPQPLDLVRTTRMHDFVMVKAANMKITFDARTTEITNVSGGGCPDVPYLYSMLVGKRLADAPRPNDIGHTLCALMLDVAYMHCLNAAEEV